MNWFNSSLADTDAPVLVRFLCCHGATSPASRSLVKTKQEKMIQEMELSRAEGDFSGALDKSSLDSCSPSLAQARR